MATKKRNDLVSVIVSFHKFGHSYDIKLRCGLVGDWLDRITIPSFDLFSTREFPVHLLDDKDFERLCFFIVEDACDHQFSNVVWLNEDGGGERGRDVIAVESLTGREFAFQCKKVKEFHPNDIEVELTTFKRYIEVDPTITPDVYILVLSTAITDKTKTKGDEIAKEIGMEIRYWPKSQVDRLIRKNVTIRDYFWRVLSTQ
jgi:hypothetical protein